jgi:hypothetical protein
MRILAIFCAILAHLTITISTATANDEMSVLVGEAKVVGIPFEISSVIVGSSNIVDLNVAQSSSLIITGLTTGRSNVIVLSERGDRYDLDVVVVADERDFIFVHNGTSETVPFRCHSRCERLTAPSDPNSAAENPSPADAQPEGDQ